jgi:acyl dehydratase
VNVEVGEGIPSWAMESVSAARMRTVAAILRDPNPVHWDRSAVAKLGLPPRTINQGPVCVGYIANMLMAWGGPTCIRRLRLGFPGVVFEEDRVVAKGEVRAVHREGGEVRVDCDVWLEHEDGRRALDGRATVVLELQTAR